LSGTRTSNRARHACNFRLVERLFAQIERVVQINELPTEVVAVAREGLVIGPSENYAI
jgi:hypothetical protein